MSQERFQPIEGGKIESKLVYEMPDEKRSCDKKDHAERSLANQPNHEKHWNKIKQNENFDHRK